MRSLKDLPRVEPNAFFPESGAKELLLLIRLSVMSIWTENETRNVQRAALQHAIMVHHRDPVKMQEIHDVVKCGWRKLPRAIEQCWEDTGVMMREDEIVSVIMDEEFTLAIGKEPPSLFRYPWYKDGVPIPTDGAELPLYYTMRGIFGNDVFDA